MATHNYVGYYLLTVPTFRTYGQGIRREVEVDGWGSLETPFTTYPDVLRVKTTLEQRDTVYVDQFGFGQAFDRPSEVKYEWFTNTDNVPVMSVTEQGGQITNEKYLAPIAAGIEEESVELSIVSLEDGLFQIVTSETVKQLQNIDINGRKITNGTTQKNMINIKNEAQGV